MSPFTPSENVTQDLSGSPLTFTDDSNYGSNSDGVNDGDIGTRVITIYDQNDVLLDTISQAQDTPATYDIDGDGYFRLHLTFTRTSDSHVFQNDVKYLSTRFYQNVQKDLAATIRCGCKVNSKKMDLMNQADSLYNAAIDSFMTGDAVGAATNITDANTLINQAALC